MRCMKQHRQSCRTTRGVHGRNHRPAQQCLAIDQREVVGSDVPVPDVERPQGTEARAADGELGAGRQLVEVHGLETAGQHQRRRRFLVAGERERHPFDHVHACFVAEQLQAVDVAGLRALAEPCGDHFAFCVILYDNTDVVPFGNRLAAVPLSCLWN